jgi:hypothetical protein
LLDRMSWAPRRGRIRDPNPARDVRSLP